MRKKGRGEAIKISNLFEVYKTRLKAPQGTVIKTFEEVVEDMFGIKIRSEQSSYTVTSRTIHVTAGGPLKSEIMLHKKEILAHLRGRLGEKSAPKDIL